MRRCLFLAVAVMTVFLGASAGAATSLSGHGTGRWHFVRSTTPDVPGSYVLHGHGGFGGTPRTITGHVTGIGFVASGRCTVVLHLTSASGTTTIRGHSVKRYPGFSNCDRDFAFHSAAGRGHIVLRTAKQTKTHTRRFVVRLS